MQPPNVALSVWLTIAAVVVGCAGPGETGQTNEMGAQPTAPKKIVAAILGDPVVLDNRAELGGAGVPGTGDITNLMTRGLTGPSPSGRRPILADAVPTFENTLWKVLPDGRMETTWKIRESTRWHDGTPVTTADLIFTTQVVRDRELANFRDQLHELIANVEAPDPRTVVVHWRSPFIEADRLFDGSSKPLPKHLLEKSYLDDKVTFMQQPYWGEAFVGNGPFKLREWVRGSHVIVDANPEFVLGPPQVNVIEVRFIPDRRAFMANFLAGTVELSLSRGLAVDEAIELGAQWRDGQLNFGYVDNAYQVFPQFTNPNPPIIATDVRFRRALLHAVDRQQIAETFMAGRTPVMHAYTTPGRPGHEEIERGVQRYDYDLRRARQILEEVGYRMGADGMFRDASNQPLSVELRNFGVAGPATYVVGDYWQRAGVDTDVVVVPEQRSRDNEYRMTFPGFQLLQNPNDLGGLSNLHTRNVALPQNNYVVNSNKSRYSNPQYDEWIDRYFVTIPTAERTQLLAQIVRFVADELPIMGLIYSMRPALVSNRLLNVSTPTAEASESWNPEQWDVKG